MGWKGILLTKSTIFLSVLLFLSAVILWQTCLFRLRQFFTLKTSIKLIKSAFGHLISQYLLFHAFWETYNPPNKITGGNVKLFCRVVGFLRHFFLWIYLGLQGLDLPLQLFDSLFLLLRLGLGLLSCTELLIKLQEKSHKYGYVHITNMCTQM